ncbi:MAG: cytochrome c [Paracoccaceae bacterium]
MLQDCGSCHGLTRKGGLGSPLTREALEGMDRQVIAEIILDGMPGTAMPPWRPLMTEEEAYWIADYLLETKE